MSTFSSLYKKHFKELLSPYGYKLCRSLFYREVNQQQCFFITAKKDRFSPLYKVYFGILPYCMDFESELEELNDIPDMLDFELASLIQQIAPELFSPETAESYYESRLHADSYDEEDTINSLQNVCSDIKKYILPYLHQFIDLQYYYDEKGKRNSWNLASPKHYGLSLKLHKYEDALHCIEYRLADCHRIMGHYMQVKEKLESGMPNNVEKRILKKSPDYAECVKRQISECNEKIAEYERIRDNLLKRNFSDSDRMVAETETRSRKHLMNLLKNKSSN